MNLTLFTVAREARWEEGAVTLIHANFQELQLLRPTVDLNFEVVMMADIEETDAEGEHRFSVTITDPHGNVQAPHYGWFMVRPGLRQCRHKFPVLLRMTGTGSVRLTLVLDGQQIAVRDLVFVR